MSVAVLDEQQLAALLQAGEVRGEEGSVRLRQCQERGGDVLSDRRLTRPGLLA